MGRLSSLDNNDEILRKYLTDVWITPYTLAMSTKHDNFKRIAENRVNRIIDSIASLRNFTNTSFYEYSDEEIDAILNAIQHELDETKEAFEKQKGKTRRFKL